MTLLGEICLLFYIFSNNRTSDKCFHVLNIHCFGQAVLTPRIPLLNDNIHIFIVRYYSHALNPLVFQHFGTFRIKRLVEIDENFFSRRNYQILQYGGWCIKSKYVIHFESSVHRSTCHLFPCCLRLLFLDHTNGLVKQRNSFPLWFLFSPNNLS